jgi:hypothetical protein
MEAFRTEQGVTVLMTLEEARAMAEMMVESLGLSGNVLDKVLEELS